MDWLLKYPVVIIVVIMVVSSIFKQMKASKSQTPPAVGGPNPMADDRGGDNDDGGYGDRTRQIQDEIRRKIAERRGQAVPSLPPAPTRVAAAPQPKASVWADQADEKEEPFVYQQEAPRLVVAETPAIDPVLERQRLLAEQLAALQLRHATVSSASQAAWAPAIPAAQTTANAADTVWLRELRNARSLRKAIILREVIGPPVALR